jgi:hypothetical protein
MPIAVYLEFCVFFGFLKLFRVSDFEFDLILILAPFAPLREQFRLFDLGFGYVALG